MSSKDKHYREAERLLADCTRSLNVATPNTMGQVRPMVTTITAMAQVHATLATVPGSAGDRGAVDGIASLLGGSPDWDSSLLESVADIVSHVRPHPGNISADEYADAFKAATGRDMEES